MVAEGVKFKRVCKFWTVGSRQCKESGGVSQDPGRTPRVVMVNDSGRVGQLFESPEDAEVEMTWVEGPGTIQQGT